MRSVRLNILLITTATMVLTAGACSDFTPAGDQDGAINTDSILFLDGTPDAATDDVPADAPATDADTVSPEVSSDTPTDTTVAQPGEFGYPCVSNGDCNSGWCIVTPEGKTCTKPCIEDCPDGWRCSQLVQGDPVFLCLPRWLHLCDPCGEATDCAASSGDLGHYCLDRGAEGSFCGGECGSDGKCPAGFNCASVPIGGGQVEVQCVPDSGSCECSPLAIELQLATPCLVDNEFGSCVGERACTANGLSTCDAATPKAEVCNGLDDDCDGAVDDLFDPTCTNTNEHGACSGAATCVGGVEFCDADTPAPEQCDGVDNNCDGTVDEGFQDTDGDTQADCVDEDDDNDGIQDTEDNCQFDVNVGQEDNDGDLAGDACDPDDDNDGSVDTEDCEPFNPIVWPTAIELCDDVDNNCNGVVDENLCDDGNPCTIDGCNVDTTCFHTADNAATCDDGSVCSQVDACLDGVCTGTAVINCDDGNACTADSCDPLQGCQNLQTGGEAEICDGIDNNCNGSIDEGFLNTDGDAMADCVDPDDDNDGVPDITDNCVLTFNTNQADNEGDGLGDLCDPNDDNDPVGDDTDCAPLDANIYQGATELCDTIDNNCNGQTDENLCDDGNLCTDDSCNGDGSCANTPNNVICNDGSICTQVDQCNGGVCVGLNPLLCNDGNACTDDSCDPVVGCLSAANTAPCTDNNECTTNDTCAGGFCVGGSPAACDDGNPCTNDSCNSVSGCQNTPLNGIACNYPGGTPQCNSAMCSGGECVLQAGSNGSNCSYPGGTPDCNVAQCSGGACSLAPGPNNVACTPGGPVGACESASCQGGSCLVGNAANGTGCATGYGDCPNGSCSGGNCQVDTGQSCNYDPDLCQSDVPGTCTSSGECEPSVNTNCTCSNCNGICFCCDLPFPFPDLAICF